MRKYNKNSWKEKIDPAFDKLIKSYVAFLGELERAPKEGQLTLPDDFIESVIKNPSWQDTYEGELSDDFFSLIKKVGLSDDEIINAFSHVINSLENPDELLKICPNLIKILPEKESRDFYTRKLKLFAENPDFKLIANLYDKNTKDFYSIIYSLLFRCFFIKFDINGNEIQATNENIEFFKNSNAIKSFLGWFFNTYSLISNQKTLTELLVNIEKGDDKSLFKAITIDKSLLFNKTVKNRIIKAQLIGDDKFFKNLGKAISDNPLKRIGQHGKTYSVLRLSWYAGLYKLTNFELYNFLKSCGLIPPSYPDAFQKFIKRHIKSVYKD